MFTGIIEEIGKVERIQKDTCNCKLSIKASKILEDIHLGDSIAVNGICLTVTCFTRQSFTVDVMNETWNRTALSLLRHGSLVNLERAMPMNGRVGGPIVTGPNPRLLMGQAEYRLCVETKMRCGIKSIRKEKS